MNENHQAVGGRHGNICDGGCCGDRLDHLLKAELAEEFLIT